ncbi:MAG: SDR family oxidoreductase [Ruminococcaceae bacterium]|nr:SDR family oxidoreductase [Oscillospiraceae bacterium]
MSIKGKVAWITAAAAGIGKATALLFAREGAKLVVCDIDEAGLQQLKGELEALGAEVLALPYDAGDTAQIDAVFNAMMQTFGTVDILVNNAGVTGPSKPVYEISVEEWDKTLEVNLRGSFYCLKLVAPVMIKNGGGKIVSLSSQTGKRALVERTPYAASKMAIIGLTRTAAEELGPHNITVNCVCPGAVEGPRGVWVRANMAKARGITVEELEKISLAGAPLRRRVPPEDVAQAILFLSDAERSNSITGEDMNVTCGAVMY